LIFEEASQSSKSLTVLMMSKNSSLLWAEIQMPI
jgi:hypothetical protein